MTWSTDWTTATHEVWPADVAEFQAAVNERHQALFGADYFDPVVAEGDVVQTFAFERDGVTPGWLRRCQLWIEAYLDRFAVSHDAGVSRGAGYYDGEQDIATYGSLAEVLSAAGVAETAWPRWTGRGSKTSGNAAGGDILPAPVLGAVQAALNVLVWTLPDAVAWVAGGENNRKDTGPVGPEASAGDAKSAAESAWDAGSADSADGLSPGENTYLYVLGSPPTDWYAGEYKAYSYAKIIGLWTGANKMIEWYAALARGDAGALAGVWDDYGEGLDAYENKLYLWRTDALTPGGADPISGAALGNVSGTGSWPGAEGAWADAGQIRGWGAGTPQPLVRWDVDGGFAYTF